MPCHHTKEIPMSADDPALALAAALNAAPAPPAPAPAPAPEPADPQDTPSAPTLEERAKVCEAMAAAFHEARAKSAASSAAADADKAQADKAHADLKQSIADLSAAAQAEDS
jgi:DNA (cytosine-5)-methyltransferase 1